MGKEILPLDDRHCDFLRDESRMVGWADSISFPESEAEVRQILAVLHKRKIPVTVQGSRTGLWGGAVPAGGHILNLSRMKKIVWMSRDGHFSLRVQPGLSLAELRRQLDRPAIDTADWDDASRDAFATFSQAARHFWPPDPTEEGASVGGIAANNGCGLTAYYYGPTAKYISAIRIVDGKGDAYPIARDRHLFINGKCFHPNGTMLILDPPPAATEPALDLLDLYLGSAGLLAAITELTLNLLPRPAECWAIVFFFAVETDAAEMIDTLRCRPKESAEAQLVAIEFLDQETLAAISQLRGNNSRLQVLPEISPGTAAAVYLEIHGVGPQPVEDLASQLLEMASHHGCGEDTAWAFSGDQEMARARLFRHAAVESLNTCLDSVRLSDQRLGIDLRMVGGSFAEGLSIYRSALSRNGLKAAIFGPAGDLHLHVNLRPEKFQDVLDRQFLGEWVETLSGNGDCVVFEHGVGMVQGFLFGSLSLPRRQAILGRLKRQLDPEWLFSPGNIFENTASTSRFR